jgi:hypothetical protein
VWIGRFSSGPFTRRRTTDPFDGKPLKLAVRDGHPVLYSVGPDAKDDGGAPFVGATKTGDITFTLKP